ncbi:MAG: acyltransferase family protein [Firmicutes bacterium]|nr:acyltransferase family protein [Bacillota bacterium]
MKIERNSSIELLRILAIFGIVVMHTNAAVMKECYGINQIWTQIENGVFNVGVSVFVLISGFYGIRRNKNKIVTLWTTVAFYSVVSAMVGYVLMGESVKSLLTAAIPISTNRYWFISCYIILMLFAPYINRFIESTSQPHFTRLLVLMSVVFLVSPTVLYYSVLGGQKHCEYVVALFLRSIHS